MGLQGGIAGSNTQLQYNNGGGFGASSNMTYQSTSNIFTFGAGNTGGVYNVIGSFFQGVTSGVPALGVDVASTAKLAYFGNGQCIELATDTNVAVIDFHSNSGQNVNFDTRIASTGGTPGVAGGGNLIFQAQAVTSQASNNYFNKSTYAANDQGIGNVNGSFFYYRTVVQPLVYRQSSVFTSGSGSGLQLTGINITSPVYTSDPLSVVVTCSNGDPSANANFYPVSGYVSAYAGNQITQVGVVYYDANGGSARVNISISFTPL